MYVALFFSLEVLVTLTSDAGRLLSKLHQAQPKGEVKFLSGVKIAHVSIEGEINRCVAMLYYLIFIQVLIMCALWYPCCLSVAACIKAQTGKEPQDAYCCVHC